MTIRQRHLNRSDDLDDGAGAFAEEGPAATQTVGAHRAADRGAPPALGGYEEHYHVTGSAALGLASILALILGIVLQTWAILVPIAIVLALLATVVRPAAVPNGFAIAFAAVRRMIAFRADQAGITLGAVPGTARGGRTAVLVPWADIQQIILYPVDPVGRGRYAQVRCIGIQRRPGAPALAQGNEQAAGSPVPDVARGATRRIVGWRLDRERLAAVAATAAPGIPVIAFSAGPSPVIEEP